MSLILANIMTIGVALLLASLLIYYWLLLPSNRRFGVFVLAAFNTAMFLEYGRTSLAYVLGINEWGYGSWAAVITRSGILLILILANCSVFIHRRRK